MAQSILGSSPVFKAECPKSSASTSTISGSKLKYSGIEQSQLGFLNSSKENLECYQELAEAQAPKNGPCETNAALEFSVNALEVIFRNLSDVRDPQ
ncbi:hypothetical protein L2E82_36024 [Cichorium intybus]|uniref:Uncharacterized protein n=1 Tax=Cichorium intybus TaxID=13427 RepID=A0ACB9BQN8_CICIN|nr:hypothetical protein L2E82_36024 [Cichorium intybus]